MSETSTETNAIEKPYECFYCGGATAMAPYVTVKESAGNPVSSDKLAYSVRDGQVDLVPACCGDCLHKDGISIEWDPFMLEEAFKMLRTAILEKKKQ